MTIHTQDPILAMTDDLFLRLARIEPYLVEELTKPAMAIPQAPQVSPPLTEPIRSEQPPASCLEGMAKAFLVTLGCLVVSGCAIVGLMKIFEAVVSETW